MGREHAYLGGYGGFAVTTRKMAERPLRALSR